MKDSTKEDINSMNFDHYESFERLEIDLSVLPEPVGGHLHKKTSLAGKKDNTKFGVARNDSLKQGQEKPATMNKHTS